MRSIALAAGALLASCHWGRAVATKITPKFFIISMFAPEADVWFSNLPGSGLGDLYAHNITTPGLSMLFEHVHCTESYDICQLTTGESEINAAASVSGLVLSDKFDFTKTYFMIAGIAGVNPKYSTLGGVALARYAVQVALQYEFDAREMPDNFTTGYVGYGNYLPDEYPTTIYGTEVFEVNEALRDLAFTYASRANLSDNDEAMEYRARYAADGSLYAMATQKPSVVKCDSATSDVYYSGTLLSEAFENTTDTWTNGSGKYCMTAQEDNATLEVMVRAAIQKLVDFSRIIVMRTGSDFDRPPKGVSTYDNLLIVQQNGFPIAIDNIFQAGVEIVKGVLKNWDCAFEQGISAKNYIGDIFGSLGGDPDFGPGSITDGEPVLPDGQSGDVGESSAKRRSIMTRMDMARNRGKRPSHRMRK